MTSTFSTSENGTNEAVIVESIEVNVDKLPTFPNNSFEPVVLKQSSNRATLNQMSSFKDFNNLKTYTRARSSRSFSGHNGVQMPATHPDLKFKLSNEYDNVNLDQLNISDISSPQTIDYSYQKTNSIDSKQQQNNISSPEINQMDQEVELTYPVLENNLKPHAEETILEPISQQDSADTLVNTGKEGCGESNRLPTLESMENLLCDRERFAYLGLVKLCLTMGANKYPFQVKEFISSHSSYTAFSKKTMQKMYARLNVENEEIQMIEKLSMHGVIPEDMAKTLLIASKEVRTTTFQNPLSNMSAPSEPTTELSTDHDESAIVNKDNDDKSNIKEEALSTDESDQQTQTSNESTKLQTIQVDLRWTILLDLFLVLTFNDTYDSRSRSLLYTVVEQLELLPENVWKMEQSVADQLQICDLAEHLEHTVESKTRNKINLKKRIALMGVASVGGGLIIGLSAGLMAPAIGIGLGVIFTKVGLASVTTFLGSAGGIGLIAGGSAAAGTGIAGSKMEKRTRGVETFKFMPVEDRNRVNVAITATGWLPNDHEDASLPFSVLDPSYGDHFSVLWEPKMLKDLGNALRMLAGEVLQFAAQEILKQTLMSSLLAALAPAMALSKLGYLIDNPWSNGLDRAQKAGLVLADILLNHSQGNRPVTLIGFSLGARMIFYCLLELARVKAFGIVQDVFIFGSPVTASKKQWAECSGVVSGRFVNGYVKSDWILGFLYRASSASFKIAGLHPVEDVDGIENKDVTHLVSGHLAYRKLMPLLMREVGIPVISDTFEDDELELSSDQMTELEASDNIEAVMSGKVQLGNVDKGIAKLPVKGTATGAHNGSNSISTFFSGSPAKRPTHTQGSKSWLDSSAFHKFKWYSRLATNSQVEIGGSIFNSNASLIPLEPDESDKFMKDPVNMTTLRMPSAPAVISLAELYATQEKQINFSDLNAPITAQVRARPTNRFI